MRKLDVFDRATRQVRLLSIIAMWFSIAFSIVCLALAILGVVWLARNLF